MSVLTAILTHLPPPLVERQLAYLRQLCPESRFVVCYGGPDAHVAALPEGTLFSADPALRGDHFDQSLNQTLRLLFEGAVRPEPDVELIYLIEYDHLILDPRFEAALQAVADRSGAGLVAKGASRCNDSNWPHYLRTRGDMQLAEFIASFSRRGDPEARWGCLGTGLLLRREALEAFCALADPPTYYFEMFVPTVIYHLGFGVADFDAWGDLYSHVRWLPEFTLPEVLRVRGQGAVFAHPFKRLDALESITTTSGEGVNASIAARSG